MNGKSKEIRVQQSYPFLAFSFSNGNLLLLLHLPPHLVHYLLHLKVG